MKYICILILLLSGCVSSVKKEEGNILYGIITNVSRVLPGYRNRKIKRLDFYIEVKEKELELQVLRYERTSGRLKYNKLIFTELDNITEKSE